MGTFSLDTTQVDTGPYVLSVAPSSILLLDDDRGQRDATATGQLMAAVAAGDRAAVLSAMRDARDRFPNGVAIVADTERASAFLFGSMVVTCETAGARVTITALDGAVDEIPMPSTLTSLTITPDGSIPLRAGEGTVPADTAMRAARVRVQLTPSVPVPPVPAVPPPVPEADTPPGGPSPAAPAPTAAPASAAPAAPSPAPSPPAAPAAPSAPAAPAAPVSPPTPAAGTPVVNVAGNVELFDIAPEPDLAREPLPVDEPVDKPRAHVLGVRCPRDHHNHPDAVYCAQCGLRMGVNHTLVAGLGPRPALGLLLLDDGTTHPIDSDMIVGREPHFHALVAGGDAVDVTVNDPELNLSREHFAIHLHDWNVTAIDLNSSNGTLLQRSQTTDWVPLSTTDPVEVSSGDKLRAGSRIFQIQLHHIQT